MPLSRSKLIFIHNTLLPIIPKDHHYLIGYIDGFYPKPKCHNIATLKTWILNTTRVRDSVNAWFNECQYNKKYSVEYKDKVIQKINWLDALLNKLQISLPKQEI